MRCSDQVLKITGYLHFFAIFVAIFGTYKQIDNVKNGHYSSIVLSLSLMIMLLLRIPNQVCVAFNSYHGWYSVLGTMIGVISYGVLTYYSNLYNEDN